MPLELRLKSKELCWLGKGFESPSIISPFVLVKEETFEESDKKRLVELGVVNEANEISVDYVPLLESLSTVDGFVQTTFSRGPISATKLIYTSGEKKVSVVYDEDDVTINFPSNPEAMVEYLKDFMGGSKLTGSDLSLEIDSDSAFIFSVIVDMYRRDVFSAYANEEVFVCGGFSKDQFLEAANNIRENSQNLSYHLFVLNLGFEEFSLEALDQALELLTKEGLLKFENDRYYLIGEGVLFAGNFLIVESILDVTVGQLKDGLLYRSNFLILQAGPLDLVYLEKSEDHTIITCMSSLDTTEFIGKVLSEKPQIV